MKKFAIMVIALSLLVVGMAMAEPGIPKVNEVQGLRTTTTVIGMGNFNSESAVDIQIITGTKDLGDIPPLADGVLGTPDGVMYQSIYTEDTQNSELGYLSYDKDLDVSTANKATGQYNVKAVKQITYLGIDASSVLTTDYLMVDGAGEDYGTIAEKTICPFGSGSWAPSFCNKVETGSTMNLKVANLNTNMADRFIMKSADPGVEIYNNVGVSSYASDLPSKGSVSAFIKGSIKEGGRAKLVEGMGEFYDPASGIIILPPTAADSTGTEQIEILPTEFDYWWWESPNDLYETMTFSETTQFSGDISSFAKGMSYSSSFA